LYSSLLSSQQEVIFKSVTGPTSKLEGQFNTPSLLCQQISPNQCSCLWLP